MSETRRVLYQINMRNIASRWLLLKEYITNARSSECQNQVQFNILVRPYTISYCRMHETALLSTAPHY